jgi:beta-alanine degradation protein BauB
VEHTYTPGETRHETHAKGHFKVHDLENTGPNELHFTTVEFLDSANQPLPVPDSVRMK